MLFAKSLQVNGYLLEPGRRPAGFKPFSYFGIFLRLAPRKLGNISFYLTRHLQISAINDLGTIGPAVMIKYFFTTLQIKDF